MVLTKFELLYLSLEFFLPPLQRQVRQRLKSLVKESGNGRHPRILDVGGRKSHYTTGVPAFVTILDLPRESELQQQLHLGLLPSHIENLRTRRSNIERVVLEDMTRCTLPDNLFDLVVSVEVLEHVEEDASFIRQVHRVLKPGGTFLMTTPNGDFVKNTNPDHKRHYTFAQLHRLLASEFTGVQIEYAIRGGKFRRYGLKSWSPGKPLQTAMSMFGNVINGLQSSSSNIKTQAYGTHHLVATARKR